ncbi:hypothetical protein [Chamaesiphon minutus]|uniref:Lipoprotein n=1 Tax=Chamaesiphon minutus (strain ATCC 27169 / PCC 6605) TaxID=1173020 RepID=K9UFI3_CHAP6|nr:hypothetical protein [Chamaesiphon minutus]AFY92969.1 hypothetical protein Cha6605_1855 [Chamaesiphon minutus PCC 6605]
MKFFNISLIALGSVSVLFLGACSSGDKATTTETTTTSSTPATAATTEPQVVKEGEKHDESSNHKHSGDKDGHSGQVVQLGKYHIELKPDLDKDSIHLDTKLHGEQDKEITDAKLLAQVQLPDGSNKTLPVLYNAEEKQYTAKLPASATKGDYKVVLQVDVKGEKFNSRFSFKQ